MLDNLYIPSKDKIAIMKLDKLRDKGDWEKDISELTPLKRKEKVSIFKKLKNGFTPYEMMYGKIENDFDYQFD